MTTQQDEGPSALHIFTVPQYMALDIPERTELLERLNYDVPAKNAPHSNRRRTQTVRAPADCR